jgi:hypothetical protein
VALAYGDKYAPGEASLCKIVQRYGTIAGLILLDAQVTSKFSSAGVDEIFFHQTPVLTVVDPDSMAVGVCERSGDRTDECWNRVLSHFPNLRYVISDEAKGIDNGVYLTNETILHQKDLHHLVSEISRTTRKLEGGMGKLLKGEEKAWQDWSKGHIYIRMKSSLPMANYGIMFAP